MQTLLEMYTLGLYRNFSGVNARLNTITMVVISKTIKTISLSVSWPISNCG